MSLASSLRTAVPLLIGLAIGGVGASLFVRSLPGAEGSPEERVSKLEVELKNAHNEIAALRDTGPRRGQKAGSEFSDKARKIVRDIKDGKNINPDDLYGAMKPYFRDFSPVFSRMRAHQEKRWVESKVGELSRKYNLTPDQQEKVSTWMKQKAEDDANRWAELLGGHDTTMEDLAREDMNRRRDDGLDKVMEGMLSGEKLTDFKTTRMTERADRVQQHADFRVQRLSSIVELDDTQRDQAFGIFARNSPDYDPAMKLEGIGGDIGSTPGGNSQEAMLAILRPDQQEAYKTARERRHAEAEKEANEMGFTLPSNWDVLDQSDF